MTNRKQKIALLNNLLEGAEKIYNYSHNDSDFQLWEQKTRRILKKIFGENSDESSQFDNLMFYYEPSLDFEDSNHKDDAFYFHRDFGMAKKMIQSFIDEINQLEKDEVDKIVDIQEKNALSLSDQVGIKKKYQIFISSTYTDLIDERQAAIEVVLKAGHFPAGMELFNAGKKQWETIKQWIDESDIYILIFGKRYGSVDPDTGKSYTENEYRYATEEKGMPGFAILLDDEWAIEKEKLLGHDVVFETTNKRLYDEFASDLKAHKTIKFAKNISEIREAILLNISQYYGNPNIVGWIRANNIQSAEKPINKNTTYVQITNNCIFSGEIRKIDKDEFSFIVNNFLLGDISSLNDICLNINEGRIKDNDNFIAIESQGDGREINKRAIINHEDSMNILTVNVNAKSKRLLPKDNVMDIKIGDDGDIIIENGDLAAIYGKDAYFQSISIALGTGKGEVLYSPESGSVFSEYYWKYNKNYKLLNMLLKIELARLLTVRISQPTNEETEAPLAFLNRIIDVRIISVELEKNRIPIDIEVEFADNIRMRKIITVYIHDEYSENEELI